MGEYNEYKKDEDNIYDFEEDHPLIIKFCHYHNIHYGLNPYYLEKQKDYDIYTLSKDIIYNKSPYKICNIKANLIIPPYNRRYFYGGHFNGKYITDYHLDENICSHLIKKYMG